MNIIDKTMIILVIVFRMIEYFFCPKCQPMKIESDFTVMISDAAFT